MRIVFHFQADFFFLFIYFFKYDKFLQLEFLVVASTEHKRYQHGVTLMCECFILRAGCLCESSPCKCYQSHLLNIFPNERTDEMTLTCLSL